MTHPGLPEPARDGLDDVAERRAAVVTVDELDVRGARLMLPGRFEDLHGPGLGLGRGGAVQVASQDGPRREPLRLMTALLLGDPLLSPVTVPPRFLSPVSHGEPPGTWPENGRSLAAPPPIMSHDRGEGQRRPRASGPALVHSGRERRLRTCRVLLDQRLGEPHAQAWGGR